MTRKDVGFFTGTLTRPIPNYLYGRQCLCGLPAILTVADVCIYVYMYVFIHTYFSSQRSCVLYPWSLLKRRDTLGYVGVLSVGVRPDTC